MLEPRLQGTSWERVLQLQHTPSKATALHNTGKRRVPSKYKNTSDFLLTNTRRVPHLAKLHRLIVKRPGRIFFISIPGWDIFQSADTLISTYDILESQFVWSSN